MAAPTMTFNAAGNVIASGTIAASSSATSAALDYSTKIAALIHIKNAASTAAASATRGLQVDVYAEYGSIPTLGESPYFTYTLPSLSTCGVAESVDFRLETGKYQIKFTNLDAANSLTASATADTIDTFA